MRETTPKPGTDIIIGVDTHKLTHAAVAISALGARLGTMTIPANSRGYLALLGWARSLGLVRAFGVEGTGSYGAGLSRFLGELGYPVLEVNQPSRQFRDLKGKDDTLDAESAARSVLAGQATALPKSGTSTVEMIRHLKVARDTAVKARSQAMQTLKAIIVSAPSALREGLDRLTGKMTLLRHLAALRPGPLTSTTASAKSGAPPRERPSPRSSDASNASSPARSLATSAVQLAPSRQSQWPLGRYRSFKAPPLS
jgi:transposase